MTMSPDSEVLTFRTQQTIIEPDAVVVDPAVRTTVPVVEPIVVAQPAVHTTTATMYRQRYAFDSLIVGGVALFMTIVGLIAVTRAGFDGPMDTPVVEVLGFTHTVRLGLIESVLGVCLLLSAASMSRSAAVFFGLVLGIGGAVGGFQTSSFERSLALESGWAWLHVVLAVVVVLVSLLVPRMVAESQRVQSV